MSCRKKVRKKEKFDSSLLFLLDGGYHVLFAVHELCVANGIDPFDNEKPSKQIPIAINLVKQLVNEEIQNDEAFTTNRYFKDVKTKAKIIREVTSRMPLKKTKKKTTLKKATIKQRRARQRI